MHDYASRIDHYCRAAIRGDFPAGKWEKAACQRHLDDVARSLTDPSWPYYFDVAEANRVCQFIELLPHVKGESAKPERTADGVLYPKIMLEDEQVFFVGVLFGWRDRTYQLRRFRRAYLEVARKNAKTTLLAGIALYMLGADDEQGPEVYAAATKKEQAKIVWEIAQEMIRREPEFRALGIHYNKSRIYNLHCAGKFEPLARDYGSLDGLNTSCFISDELHAQKDRGLYDVLDSSTGARAQPLGIGITTSGTDRTGICYETRTYLTKVLNTILHAHDGMGYRVQGGRAIDDSFFGVIYTLDVGYAIREGEKQAASDDDWADPAVWSKANPMLRAKRNETYARNLLADLTTKVQKAKETVAAQSEFRTKHCNQWLNADTSWMDMHAWANCADPDLREEEFAGLDCVVALDAAFKTDIFAKIKIIERNGIYYAFGKYYAPRRMLDMKGNEQLAAWAQEGWITASDGEVVDIEHVRDDIRHDAGLHTLTEVAFDPHQLTQFAGEMLQDGVQMVELRPTVLNFSEPMKRLTELVLTGRFRHNGDPVLEWMASNVVCHTDHKDNIYPNKEKPENKIDGIVALIMGLSRMQVVAVPEAPPQFQAFFV